MSSTTKRKYVAQEFLEGLILPDDTLQQQIVQVVGPKGNNLHEVQSPSGERFLVTMPTKFRKSIWIKRGDFVLVEPISEGDRVKAEITHILRTKEQIAHIRSQGKWPPEFDKILPVPIASGLLKDRSGELDGNPLSDEEDYGDLSPNLNRCNDLQNADEESETTSSESGSDE